jgi:hypothetical protein
MRNSVRLGAIAVTAAAATSLAVLPAGAASADGAPPAIPVHHAAVHHHHAHHHAVPIPAPAPPLGKIIICNHSGYMFNVYADGPSLRTDDLAGSFDECTDWARVLPGAYQVGFGLRTASSQNVVIQARFKRDDHVFYKVFNREGVLSTNVGPDQLTRVDLFIPQG